MIVFVKLMSKEDDDVKQMNQPKYQPKRYPPATPGRNKDAVTFFQVRLQICNSLSRNTKYWLTFTQDILIKNI